MLSLFLHWLHLLGVVFWIGGIGYIIFVLLPNMSTIALRDRAKLVPRILKRFLKVVWISIFIIVLSGLYRVIFVMRITTIEQLIFTRYGNILGIKILLVIALITVALSVTLRVYRRTVSHVTTHNNDSPDSYSCPLCKNIIGSMQLHLETGLALAFIIIFLAAMLRGA